MESEDKNMSKLLDKFDDYTIQDNMGFKIVIGNLVVSVACHNYMNAYSNMEGNGIVEKDLDYSKMPRDLMVFTFCTDNTEVVVFDKKTGEYLTDKFIDTDDYDNIAYGVSPLELIDILVKVKEYVM